MGDGGGGEDVCVEVCVVLYVSMWDSEIHLWWVRQRKSVVVSPTQSLCLSCSLPCPQPTLATSLESLRASILPTQSPLPL